MRYGKADPPSEDAGADAAPLLAVDWTSEDRDETWLISYADILSVIFAMVVLLFGRMALLQAPTVVEAEPVEAVARIAVPPLAAPAAAPSPEDRLALLIEQRFSGQIEAKREAAGLLLTISDVALFDSARAGLHATARPMLDNLVATLREVGEARVSVQGHTDSLPVTGGEFDSNWDLAAARANAVTRYLLEQGFDPARVQSVSHADTRPIADNDTMAGRAANRRVELEIEFARNGADSAAQVAAAARQAR